MLKRGANKSNAPDRYAPGDYFVLYDGFMKLGTKVKLKSFNGTIKPEEECRPSENYWTLVGCNGEIVQDPNQNNIYADFSSKPRLLVKFESNIISLGLECHNNVNNSLWIMESDLEEIK